VVRLSRIRDPGRPGFVWPSPQVLSHRRTWRGWHEKAAAGPGGGTRRPPLWGRRARRDGGILSRANRTPVGVLSACPGVRRAFPLPRKYFRGGYDYGASYPRRLVDPAALHPGSAARSRGARTGSPASPTRPSGRRSHPADPRPDPAPGHRASPTRRPADPQPDPAPDRDAPPTRNRTLRPIATPRRPATEPSARSPRPADPRPNAPPGHRARSPRLLRAAARYPVQPFWPDASVAQAVASPASSTLIIRV
jgi:hypothetical protein